MVHNKINIDWEVFLLQVIMMALKETLKSAMVVLRWLLYNAVMALLCASYSVVFKRGIPTIPAPTSFQSFTLESQLRCGLICSRDIKCEFFLYQSHEQNCYHYLASELQNHKVALNSEGLFSFRGRLYIQKDIIIPVSRKLGVNLGLSGRGSPLPFPM